MTDPIDRRSIVAALSASAVAGLMAGGGTQALAAQPGLKLGSPTAFSFANAGSRIAKPLRGGGGDVPTIPTISNLQNEAAKRASWFFQK